MCCKENPISSWIDLNIAVILNCTYSYTYFNGWQILITEKKEIVEKQQIPHSFYLTIYVLFSIYYIQYMRHTSIMYMTFIQAAILFVCAFYVCTVHYLFGSHPFEFIFYLPKLAPLIRIYRYIQQTHMRVKIYFFSSFHYYNVRLYNIGT